MRFVAGSYPFQMGDQFAAVRDTVGANLPGDTRLQNLLGSPGPHAQKALKRLAVDPRPRQAVEFSDHLIQTPIPDGFIGHLLNLTH